MQQNLMMNRGIAGANGNQQQQIRTLMSGNNQISGAGSQGQLASSNYGGINQ